MLGLLAMMALGANVEVIGVGPVSLEDATAACLEGNKLGEMQGRVPVFATVAGAQLGRDADKRVAYYELQADDVWPTDKVQVDTWPGSLLWTAPGAIAACAAVGQHWIAEGQRLRPLCVEKKECKAAFPDDDLWKDMYEVTQATLEDPEKFYLALRKDPRLTGLWQDPMPFLDKGCEGPRTAVRNGELVDQADLDGARASCLQLLTLVEGQVPERISRDCSSMWGRTEADREYLLAVESTMSAGPRVGSGHRDRLHTQLAAMDPTGMTCKRDWGDLHKGTLVASWRGAQSESACGDEGLDLADRVALCPNFRGMEQGRCMKGEVDGCMRAATMAIEGIGSEPAVRPAVDLYRRACEAGEEDGCRQVTGHQADVTSWFGEALVGTAPLPPQPAPEPPAPLVSDDPGATPEPATQPPEPPPPAPPEVPETAAQGFMDAGKLLAEYGPHLGDEWVSARRQQLVQARLALWQASEVEALMGQEPPLDATFHTTAETQLQALRDQLEARLLWEEEQAKLAADAELAAEEAARAAEEAAAAGQLAE